MINGVDPQLDGFCMVEAIWLAWPSIGSKVLQRTTSQVGGTKGRMHPRPFFSAWFGVKTAIFSTCAELLEKADVPIAAVLAVAGARARHVGPGEPI